MTFKSLKFHQAIFSFNNIHIKKIVYLLKNKLVTSLSRHLFSYFEILAKIHNLFSNKIRTD